MQWKVRFSHNWTGWLLPNKGSCLLEVSEVRQMTMGHVGVVCLLDEVTRQNESYARSPGVFDVGQSNPGSTWGERHFDECYPSLFSILIPVTAVLGLHQIERLSLTKHIKLTLWLLVVHFFEAAIPVGMASTKSVTDSLRANRCTIYLTAFFPLQDFETLSLPFSLKHARTPTHTSCLVFTVCHARLLH